MKTTVELAAKDAEVERLRERLDRIAKLDPTHSDLRTYQCAVRYVANGYKHPEQEAQGWCDNPRCQSFGCAKHDPAPDIQESVCKCGGVRGYTEGRCDKCGGTMPSLTTKQGEG